MSRVIDWKKVKPKDIILDRGLTFAVKGTNNIIGWDQKEDSKAQEFLRKRSRKEQWWER